MVTLVAGCAVPLGPGFHFRSRRAGIEQTTTTPLRVHVRVTDQLANMGNRDLTYLDVTPPSSALGATNLRIRVDGREAQAAPVTAEPGAPVRIRFQPPWPQKQVRSFVFDYDLESNPTSLVFAATPDAFFLADPNGFPRWIPPPGVFVTADSRARKEEFEVTVPSGFRALAGGRQRRSRRQGELTLHRYRISRETLPLFVIAGRYQELRLDTAHRDVIFWTLQPLDVQAAQRAAERLAETAAMYQEIFGPVARGRRPIHIVEMPAAPAQTHGNEPELSAASFPYGVLLGQRAFAKGIADDSVLELAERELARTWFGWLARPSPEARSLLGRGAGLYAAVMAAEVRGGAAARSQMISRLFLGYDGQGSAADAALSSDPSASDTRERRAAEAYKAALFLVALEDLAGKEQLQRAARRVVQARAGRETAAGDLRSALEAETGSALADVFRTWLSQSDIPADFRARYDTTP